MALPQMWLSATGNRQCTTEKIESAKKKLQIVDAAKKYVPLTKCIHSESRGWWSKWHNIQRQCTI